MFISLGRLIIPIETIVRLIANLSSRGAGAWDREICAVRRCKEGFLQTELLITIWNIVNKQNNKNKTFNTTIAISEPTSTTRPCFMPHTEAW